MRNVLLSADFFFFYYSKRKKQLKGKTKPNKQQKSPLGAAPSRESRDKWVVRRKGQSESYVKWWQMLTKKRLTSISASSPPGDTKLALWPKHGRQASVLVSSFVCVPTSSRLRFFFSFFYAQGKTRQERECWPHVTLCYFYPLSWLFSCVSICCKCNVNDLFLYYPI